MRHVAVVLAMGLALSGCSALGMDRQHTAADAQGLAAPPPDVVGTWRGTAFAVPGSTYGISTPVELTINPDGTWSWSKRGQEQARGRVQVRGDRVLLAEDTAKDGAQTIELSRRGDHLWGLSGGFIPGFPSAVDLRRATS